MTAATVNAPRMTPALLAGLQAAAYIRVSSDEQARPDRFGPDLQRDTIARFADRLGVKLVATFEDIGVSGTKPIPERPGLSAALDAIGAGMVEILIAAAPDRLARETEVALIVERATLEAGGIVLYGDGGIDPEALLRWLAVKSVDDDEQTNRELKHVMSSADRRRIVSRLRAARERKAAAGGFAHGRIPYGYISVNGRLEPDRHTAPTVERIYKLTAQGATPGDIARHLRDTPAPRGGSEWRRNSLHVIIRNPVYIGEQHGIKKAHHAIVSRRLWNQAQAALDARRRT